jgi:glyoxylase-like metal-dependent hydrolase (beta-lactamase superfamily II)
LAEISFVRAAIAQAQSSTADAKHFDIQKVEEGVFSCLARPAALINCNATIFEQSNHLVVVDTHSKASAAASLIAQIKREVSDKPVRHIINTHFHWDHAQGTSAYREAFSPLDVISSKTARQAIEQETEKRIRLQLQIDVPVFIETARKKRTDARSTPEREFYGDQIRQLEAYRKEMAAFELVVPTITFDDTYILKDAERELHLSFHGRAHTGGDVVVLSPRDRLLATGDLIHGFFPYIGDGYPRQWPATINQVAALDFTRLLPGHGPVQTGRGRMTNFRNYVEELTQRVAAGKEQGNSVKELQQTITASSLRSLSADGYGDFLSENAKKYRPNFGAPPPLQESINLNIEHAYQRLDA